MNHLSIRVRLILGFAIPIVFLLVAVFVGVRSNEAIRTSFTTVSEVNVPIVNLLQTQKFIASRLISSTNEFVLDWVLESEEGEEAEAEPLSVVDETGPVTDNDEADETVNAASEADEDEEEDERAEIEESLETYAAVADNYRQLVVEKAPGEIPYLENVETTSQNLIGVTSSILQVIDSGGSIDDVRELREELEEVEVDFLVAINQASEFELYQFAARQIDVDTTVQQSLSISVGVIIVALIATTAFSIYLIGSITRPLRTLINVTARLRNNDLTARTNLTGADELGEMGRTFDEMAGSLQQRQQDLETANRQLEYNLDEVEAARAEAERSNQVKSAFLASMSHELRTPLNAIINYTKFVVKGVMGEINADQEDALNNVVDSAKHLLSLINDVLDISKIESGSLNLFVEDDVDMNEIVASAASTGRSLLVDKPEVALELVADENLPIMVGDRQRILQIILNIVSNACKFTETGKVIISAETTADEIQISVNDTGPGIPKDEFVKVFDPFGQTGTGLREGGGTGLGMPIARSLAEAHGGRVWLESEPGVGSTFYLALPLQSALTPA